MLWGRAHEAGGAPAYWPWVLALRQLVEAADGEELRGWLGAGASEVARIVPELREQLLDLAEPEAVSDPQSAQFRLFDATKTFIANAARTTPLVVVLDDVHWANRHPAPRGLAGAGPAVVWISPDASPAAAQLALAIGIAMRLWHDDDIYTFGLGGPMPDPASVVSRIPVRPPPEVSAFAVAFFSRGRDTKCLNALGEGRFRWQPPF